MPPPSQRSVGSRTIDGASMLRCMTVALSDEQDEACRRAIVPVEIVKTADVREACAKMSTVLPLVVVVDEAISDADRSTLSEMAVACGAEIVTAFRSESLKPFAAKLLDALRVAERRRLGMR
jgi:hypothetical protein